MSDISYKSPSTPTLLGVLFVALKLTHVISWSWWWVLLPFWLAAVLFVFTLVVALVVLATLERKTPTLRYSSVLKRKR